MEVLRIYYILSAYRMIKLPAELRVRKSPTPRIHRTIDSFADSNISIFFRFRNKEQLHRLIDGFQINDVVVHGHRFVKEEILLVSLYRLHRPTTIYDACWEAIFALLTLKSA